ncbi:S8 family serine peptidase [Thermomonospora umbrina]|uniref:S8 family serine peptidase n=1 Tax=Thermomonospora umbrina TaxID=111806 RepID=UPI000E276511|nr:S8 family serine peptidase [Thermomonospora umbrina]
MVRRLMWVAAATLAIALAGVPTAAAGAVPSPNVNQQWWFDSWAIERQVWPLTQGDGVTVALIDSGVNASLPDLRNVVLPGKDVTGGGTDGRKDIDEEAFGHGTGMASLIASQGTGTGFVGIAPGVKILPITNRDLGDATLVPAIRFAVDRGAKVINISQASAAGPRECPPAVQSAIAYAAQKDVVILAGAGNTGDTHNVPNFPASCPGVVGVGAIDNRGVPWKSSQRQDYVTVAAPGSGIPALSRDGRVWPQGDGTSHATALASGAVALVRSRYPNMSARDVVQLVTNTAVDLGPKGKDDMTGFGGISIRRALRQKVPANAPNPVYERLDRVLAQSSSGGSGAGSGPSAAEEDTGSGNGGLIKIAAIVMIGIGVIGAPITIAYDRRKKRNRNLPPPPPSYSGGPGPGMPPSFGGGQQPYGQAPQGQPPYGHGQGPYGPPPAQQPPYPPRQGE